MVGWSETKNICWISFASAVAKEDRDRTPAVDDDVDACNRVDKPAVREMSSRLAYRVPRSTISSPISHQNCIRSFCLQILVQI